MYCFVIESWLGYLGYILGNCKVEAYGRVTNLSNGNWVVNMHNKPAKISIILFLLFPGYFCSQTWCIYCNFHWIILFCFLSLVQNSSYSKEGGRTLPTILTLERTTEDRTSWYQPALLLHSLKEGEQHRVCGCHIVHTHIQKHLCVYIYVFVYTHTYIHTHTSQHCPYIMLPHPTPSSSIDHHLMHHSFYLNPPLPHSVFLDSTTLDFSFHLPSCPFRSQAGLPEEMSKDCTTWPEWWQNDSKSAKGMTLSPLLTWWCSWLTDRQAAVRTLMGKT